MKWAVRNGVFETNSSSVHSLVYSSDADLLDIQVDKEGNAISYLGYYGRNNEEIKTEQDKLDYLITYSLLRDMSLSFMYANEDEDEPYVLNPDDCEDYSGETLPAVIRILKERFGYNGLKMIVNPGLDYIGFDHQSAPGEYEDNPLDPYMNQSWFGDGRLENEDWVCFYLTNPAISVYTTGD